MCEDLMDNPTTDDNRHVLQSVFTTAKTEKTPTTNHQGIKVIT